MKFFLKIFIIFFFNFNFVYSDVINNIQIEGNNRISDSSIIVFSDLNNIKIVNKKVLDSVVKKLYETNFFENISINYQNGFLKINVIEYPIIEDLEIIGIKNKNLKEFIEDKIILKNRQSFNKSLLKKDIDTIENILKVSGYYFSEVKAFTESNPELNSVQVKFSIDLGSKAKINNITFLGNTFFKSSKLRELIVSEEHKFWKFLSKNVFINQQLIELDKRLLIGFYKDNGFYDMTIDASFVEYENSDKSGFNLIYKINPGKSYNFGEITFNIPDGFDKKLFTKINKDLSKLQGKLYSQSKIENTVSEIENIALTKQYEFVNASISENKFNNIINLEVNIFESEKFYVERIDISGNFTTIEEVIRNELIVDEGDPLNEILFNKSLNNLRATGFFKNVNSKQLEGKTENFKIIEIDVEEQPTGEISLGAGFGTSGETIGGGIKENNFLGKGIGLNTNLELTSESIKGQFIYSQPNFNYSDNTLNTKIASTRDDYLKDFGYKTSDFEIALSTEFEQYTDIFFIPEINFKIQNLETNNNASNTIKKQAGDYSDLYFNYSFINDTRNNKFKPSSGNKSTFRQELPFISESAELSNSFEFTTYKKLSTKSDFVGRASVYGKMINGLNEDVRISKRLFIPYSKLRGFKKGKTGPRDGNDYIGGNYISALNLSTSVPTLLNDLENIDISLFFDAANVWGVDYDDSKDNNNEIKSSTGVSLDLLTPVGPFSFSYSLPVSKASNDQTENFRFNLGTTF